MKKPVWHSENKGTARQEFIAFAAGRDVVPLKAADEILIPYDLWTNRAHALGLYHVGIYEKHEIELVLHALTKLEKEWQTGEWQLDENLEDIHINIEDYVTKECGEEIGGKLHTGRSRNDQVATDMKLFCRDIALEFAVGIGSLIESIIQHANKHLKTVMPGYTHHRKATLTTWAHYCASYAQALLRDLQRLSQIAASLDQSPLGAAASYGTTWPLDRQYTAHLLAFADVQENTLDAIVSRGEFETEIAQAISIYFKHLSNISQDLILFSTDEFAYLDLPSDFTTGSSIMPQKRNPDFAEAIKGKGQLINGYTQSLMAINYANQSGYNKDAQWSKYVFIDLIHEARGAANILSGVFNDIVVNKEIMKEACLTGFLNAVDIADHLARTRKLPFRSTYGLISSAVGVSKNNFFELNVLNGLLLKHQIQTLSEDEYENLTDPLECVKNRNHIGAPHPEQTQATLDTLLHQCENYVTQCTALQTKIEQAEKKCIKLD